MADERIHGCFHYTLARRTGTPSCWAKFEIEPQKSLCIPLELWKKRIQTPEIHPLCGEWEGKWSSWSPPENSIHFKHKKILYRFKVNELPIKIKSSFLYSLIHFIENKREEFSDLLKKEDSYGIYRKLILNESTPQSPTGMFLLMGFVHLLTSAGIHLYALAQWIDFISLIFFKNIQISVLWGIRLSRVFTFLCWSWIWMLNGMRAGMLRPWILVMLQRSCTLLGFRWKLWAPLTLAMILDILITQNFSDQGRWFYILAIGGGTFSRGFSGNSHLSLSVSSWIFAALWEAWEYGLVALATPVVSLISIPVFTLFTLPGLLFGLTFSSHKIIYWICYLSDEFVFYLLKICIFLKTLWVVPNIFLFIGALFSGCIFLAPYKNKKILFSLFIFPALGVRIFWNFDGIKIEQLDVGQGDSALIQSHKVGFTGLLDTGSGRMLSDESWIKLLASRNINHLSWVALTHLDEDHAGATHRLSRLLPIDCIATSEQELELPRGLHLKNLLENQNVKIHNWNSHCVPFPVYSPPDQYSKKRNRNMSAVLITLPQGGFYLSAGDADARDEIKIAKWVKSLHLKKSELQILKVSHHGSRFSTTSEFLSLIQPSQAWISVGVGNSYGHPTSQTLSLLSSLNIPIHRTDFEGALHIKMPYSIQHEADSY